MPGPLPGWNDLLRLKGNYHYVGAYNKVKRRWQQIIQVAALARRVRPVAGADFTFEWRERSRIRNPDNITAGVKFVLDALVGMGILRNDGWSEIRSLKHLFPQPPFKEPGVLVTMETAE